MLIEADYPKYTSSAIVQSVESGYSLATASLGELLHFLSQDPSPEEEMKARLLFPYIVHGVDELLDKNNPVTGKTMTTNPRNCLTIAWQTTNFDAIPDELKDTNCYHNWLNGQISLTDDTSEKKSECQNPGYSPYVWSNHPNLKITDPFCFDRRVFVNNEPENPSQANMNPQDSAKLWGKYRNWPGHAAVGGNLYFYTGYDHFVATLYEFEQLYGPIQNTNIDSIHLHIHEFANAPVEVSMLDKWRLLADSLGLDIIVTEYSAAYATPEESAEHLAELHRKIANILKPSQMFIYAVNDCSQDISHSFELSETNLMNCEGGLSPVGKRWLELIVELPSSD